MKKLIVILILMASFSFGYDAALVYRFDNTNRKIDNMSNEINVLKMQIAKLVLLVENLQVQCPEKPKSKYSLHEPVIDYDDDDEETEDNYEVEIKELPQCHNECVVKYHDDQQKYLACIAKCY